MMEEASVTMKDQQHLLQKASFTHAQHNCNNNRYNNNNEKYRNNCKNSNNNNINIDNNNQNNNKTIVIEVTGVQESTMSGTIAL